MDTYKMIFEYLKDVENLQEDEDINFTNHGSVIIVKTLDYIERTFTIQMLDLIAWVYGNCLNET